MATQRMVTTTIWTKSQKFIKLDPLQRYLFLYLITNERVELCGAYEMMLREMALWTGLDERETLPNMLQALEDAGLAAYIDGWVVIPNYLKLQNLNNRSVKAGVEKSLSELPTHIRQAVDTLSTPSTQVVRDLDLDLDLDSDIDVDVDSTLATYRDELSALLPSTAWRNLQEQLAALHRLTKMTKETQPTTPLETPEEFARMAVATYARMKQTGRGDYWKRAAFDPKGLELRFTDVVTEMAGEYDRLRREEEDLERVRRGGFLS
jgi:hypothetical protein